jgi:hypothetical protein
VIPIELRSEHAEALTAAVAAVEAWPLDSPGTLSDLARIVDLDATLSDLGIQVRASLNAADVAVLHNVPTDSDAAILAIFMTVAVPCSFGNGGAEGESLVYSIAPREGPTADLSETNLEFPVHTDSTFLREPHHYVGLCCIESGEDTGGETQVIRQDALTQELTRAFGEDALAALCEPCFPFFLRDPFYGTGVQLAPILEPSDAGFNMRYRHDVMASLMAEFGAQCGENSRKALDAMAATAAAMPPALAAQLRPGDYLIFDNRKVLHGRTPIPASSRRVLRRLKGYARTDRNYRIVVLL